MIVTLCQNQGRWNGVQNSRNQFWNECYVHMPTSLKSKQNFKKICSKLCEVTDANSFAFSHPRKMYKLVVSITTLNLTQIRSQMSNVNIKGFFDAMSKTAIVSLDFINLH